MTEKKAKETDEKRTKDSSLEDILEEVENLKEKEEKKANETKKREKNEKNKEEEIDTRDKKDQEIQDLNEKLLRVSADLQNIRRRSDSERLKHRREGATDVLKPVLTAVDNFSRAFENIPKELEENPFVTGIVNVEKNFQESLTALGVEFFGKTGDDFDAERHESMMLSSEGESGKIAQVFEQGVLFKGSIIRHAKVSVGQ